MKLIREIIATCMGCPYAGYCETAASWVCEHGDAPNAAWLDDKHAHQVADFCPLPDAESEVKDAD